MYEPYCNNLREAFIQQAKENDVAIVDKGVYVCFKGPRFETKAEIRMFQMVGGTLVGMTNVPEVTLAKELGLCYSAVGLVSNMGCGMKEENITEIDHSGVIQQVKKRCHKGYIRCIRKKEVNTK